MKAKLEMLEENVKMKEKLVKNNNKNNISENAIVDDMYISAIKAKLELLQDNNNAIKNN